MRHDVGAEFLTRAAGTMISEVSLLNGRVQIGGSVCPKIEKKASLVVHSCVRVTRILKTDSTPEYRLTGLSCGCVGVWMVVRFVCVIRVPVCTRVCLGSLRCSLSFYH
jgi:hypothetical protein